MVVSYLLVCSSLICGLLMNKKPLSQRCDTKVESALQKIQMSSFLNAVQELFALIPDAENPFYRELNKNITSYNARILQAVGDMTDTVLRQNPAFAQQFMKNVDNDWRRFTNQVFQMTGWEQAPPGTQGNPTLNPVTQASQESRMSSFVQTAITESLTLQNIQLQQMAKAKDVTQREMNMGILARMLYNAVKNIIIRENERVNTALFNAKTDFSAYPSASNVFGVSASDDLLVSLQQWNPNALPNKNNIPTFLHQLQIDFGKNRLPLQNAIFIGNYEANDVLVRQKVGGEGNYANFEQFLQMAGLVSTGIDGKVDGRTYIDAILSNDANIYGTAYIMPKDTFAWQSWLYGDEDLLLNTIGENNYGQYEWLFLRVGGGMPMAIGKDVQGLSDLTTVKVGTLADTMFREFVDMPLMYLKMFVKREAVDLSATYPTNAYAGIAAQIGASVTLQPIYTYQVGVANNVGIRRYQFSAV